MQTLRRALVRSKAPTCRCCDARWPACLLLTWCSPPPSGLAVEQLYYRRHRRRLHPEFFAGTRVQARLSAPPRMLKPRRERRPVRPRSVTLQRRSLTCTRTCAQVELQTSPRPRQAGTRPTLSAQRRQAPIRVPFERSRAAQSRAAPACASPRRDCAVPGLCGVCVTQNVTHTRVLRVAQDSKSPSAVADLRTPPPPSTPPRLATLAIPPPHPQ